MLIILRVNYFFHKKIDTTGRNYISLALASELLSPNESLLYNWLGRIGIWLHATKFEGR